MEIKGNGNEKAIPAAVLEKQRLDLEVLEQDLKELENAVNLLSEFQANNKNLSEVQLKDGKLLLVQLAQFIQSMSWKKSGIKERYADFPWYHVEYLSILLHSPQNKENIDTDSTSKSSQENDSKHPSAQQTPSLQQSICDIAVCEIIQQDAKELLHRLQFFLDVEKSYLSKVKENEGQMDGIKQLRTLPPILGLPHIRKLTSHFMDKERIKTIIHCIQNFSKTSFDSNSPKKCFSMFRLLIIIGECVKLISEEVKDTVKDSIPWINIEKLRDHLSHACRPVIKHKLSLLVSLHPSAPHSLLQQIAEKDLLVLMDVLKSMLDLRVAMETGDEEKNVEMIWNKMMNVYNSEHHFPKIEPPPPPKEKPPIDESIMDSLPVDLSDEIREKLRQIVRREIDLENSEKKLLIEALHDKNLKKQWSRILFSNSHNNRPINLNTNTEGKGVKSPKMSKEEKRRLLQLQSENSIVNQEKGLDALRELRKYLQDPIPSIDKGTTPLAAINNALETMELIENLMKSGDILSDYDLQCALEFNIGTCALFIGQIKFYFWDSVGTQHVQMRKENVHGTDGFNYGEMEKQIGYLLQEAKPLLLSKKKQLEEDAEEKHVTLVKP